MIDENHARDELESILSQKEYTDYYKPPGLLETLWEKAKQWVLEQLMKLFPSMEASNAMASTIVLIAIIVGIAVLAILAIWLIRYTNRKRKYRNQTPFQSRDDMNWSFHMHVEEAKSQEAQGQYSAATRHLFLALLLYFHEKKWLEAKIWKTNWEYFEELKKVNRADADEFYHLALMFDEVTYGEKVVEQAEYEQYRLAAMKWLDDFDEQASG